MVRPDYAKLKQSNNKNQSSRADATKRAEALRTEIFSLASDMPKKQCPPLAAQMSESISRITELLYMNDDSFINQQNSEKREVIRGNIKTEIKMLSLLTQLALERGNIDRAQHDEIVQKIHECKQVIFFDVF